MDSSYHGGRLSTSSYPPNSSNHDPKIQDGPQFTTRTPSPTPSETRALSTGVFDWRTMRNWRFWIRREWLWYYVALVVILVVTALVTLYHKQIVDWLTPVTRWLHDLKFGWLVPIGVLFVISFPPLFGHEIVAILCGLVWGLWIGFAIVSAGTFIGEVGNFYAFKYLCRARGEKLERTKINYACLAKVVREGGFRIALIARLSAIPGHFTTAVFSTCGMGILVFSLAAILSMPKQFITVYLGVILEGANAGTQDPKSRIISDVLIAVTFLITILAMWYILRQMNKVRPRVIYERRKARQAKFARAEAGSPSPLPFAPDHYPQHNSNKPSFGSDSTIAIPLNPGQYGGSNTNPYGDPEVQRSSSRSSSPLDSSEYGPGKLYAPQPRAPEYRITDVYGHDGALGKGLGKETSIAKESTEEVGWEMRVKDARTDRYPYGGGYSSSSGNGSWNDSMDSVHWAPSSNTLHTPGGAVPVQGYGERNSEQWQGPDHLGHFQEPTDRSYRTAVSSREPSSSADSSVGIVPTTGRRGSPPLPSDYQVIPR